jgi:UDP-2,3-diacylglucosamine pyrophosphatase LpxH
MNKKLFCLIFSSLTLISCNKDTDVWGVIIAYNTANQRFRQSEEWNTLHGFKTLNVISENYSIVVGGDTHIGGINNFMTFLVEAEKPENLAFVLVGDLVTGRKTDYDTLKYHLPKYENHPFFLLPGNHDLYFDGWKTYFDYFGSASYFFTVQTPTSKDIFICLDSSGGGLGDLQTQWLTNLLDLERSKYRNCVILTHINFFDANNKWALYPLIQNSSKLQTLFTKYNVNMVVSGHVHKKTIKTVGSTTYLTVIALMDTNSSVNFLKLSIGSNISFNYKSISNK